MNERFGTTNACRTGLLGIGDGLCCRGNSLPSLAGAPRLDHQGSTPNPHRDTPKGVAVVVLAAGRSSRMGANKLTAMLGDKSVIAHVVDAIAGAGLAPPTVVVGGEAQLVRDALAGRSATFVDAPDCALGLSQSLRSGIETLTPGARAAMICLGDMPFIPSQLLRALAAMADGDRIIAPRRNGRIGNPIVWGSGFFEDLTRLTGDAGARSLLAAHDERLSFVECDDDGIFIDIDTPAALAAASRRSTAKRSTMIEQ